MTLVDTELSEDDSEAALACIAALTEYFDPDTDNDWSELLEGVRPGGVTEFLFGQLAAHIGTIAEVGGITPLQHVQQMALQVQRDIYGVI